MLGMERGHEPYGYLNDGFTWKNGEEKLFYESFINRSGRNYS